MPVKFHPYIPIDLLDKTILKVDGSPLYGEIDIYKKLYYDLKDSDEEWEIWHDLKLPEHSDVYNYYNKTSAQIDFLILYKEGILVLEVKGGPISMKDNTFFYGKNFEDKMPQNPFRQVEGYKYTLKDKILNNIKGCFFCDTVAFPHVNYSFDAKIIDQNLLWTEYLSGKYINSIESFLKHVFNYTKERHKKHFKNYPELTSKEIEAIRKILSPLIYDKNEYNSIKTLEWLQINNLEILESLYKNQRIMIEGPPGSGKTTIAKAFIDQHIGKRGIYVCWNNLLMHYTKHFLKKRNTAGKIEVTTFFKFLTELNPEVSKKSILKLNEDEFYLLLKSTLIRLEIDEQLPQYDFIVIDEAQDIFDRGLDLFINKLCGYNKTGLKSGNALILYDIDQSYSASGRNVAELADLLTEYFTHFKLNEVKRSAQNPDIRNLSIKILENPKILLDTDFGSNFPVISVFKHKKLEDVKKYIVHKILNLIRSDISSLKGWDCIILIEAVLLKGSYRGESDMRYELTIKDVEELDERNITDTANKLRYSSILKYKGLEKQNVFLVITEPCELNKYELYVGITRAIYNLEIHIIKP